MAESVFGPATVRRRGNSSIGTDPLDARRRQASADACRSLQTNRNCRRRVKTFREGRYGPCLRTPYIAQTCKSEAEGEGEMRPLVASPGWTREEDDLLQAFSIFGNQCCGDGEAVAP